MATKRKAVEVVRRVREGNSVLAAAKSIDTKSIRERLAVFEKRHKDFSEAEGIVKEAENELASQTATVKKRVETLKEQVDDLAAALTLDGEPRVRPFAAFGEKSVSAVQLLPHSEISARTERLAKAAMARKGASKTTMDVAMKLVELCATIDAEVQVHKTLESKRHHAVKDRDALVAAWEKAWKSLKRGALDAEDEGAVGLYDALFARRRKPTAKPMPEPPQPVVTG